MERMSLKPRISGLSPLCVSLIALALFIGAASVSAGESQDLSGRIRWIQDRLDTASGPARTWQYGWTTAYGAMTYLYTAQASSLDRRSERHDHHDAVVNACTSALGFAGMVLDPLSNGGAAEQLKRLPETTDDEKRIKLDQAESFLRQAAERERRGKSWLAHTLAALVSLSAGTAVATNGHRAGDGVAMFAGSMLVSEIQIFSQPLTASRAWDEYSLGRTPTVSENPTRTGLTLSVHPHGIMMGFRF
jgi:hypothetical protein